MSIFDEYDGGSADFPMPDEVKEFWGEGVELDADERRVGKAPCKQWELLSLRANGGFKDNDGKPKGVINIRAKGLSEEYPHTGEVAFWLEAAKIDNERNPQRRTAAMLGQMFQKLGLLAADAKPGSGKEVLEMLVAAANKTTPKATFKAQLRWEKRAYVGRDGEKRHGREHSFAFIDSVTLGEGESKGEDLPF